MRMTLDKVSSVFAMPSDVGASRFPGAATNKEEKEFSRYGF